MAANTGAVGERGARSGDRRTNRGTRSAGRTRFIAAIVVVLLVGVFASVLLQMHTPPTTRSSKPYTLDYLLWTAEGDQDTALFGDSVSCAGDVNDDGYDDVVVGAHHYSSGQNQEGRAFLYLGSSTGPSTTPSWTAESNQDFAFLGWSVSSAGDVNGDGCCDVVIGAPYYANGESGEGRAFVYLGSSSGLSTTPSWTAEGNQYNAQFGRSVSPAGDVNNDGYDDIVIGAPYYTNGEWQEGCMCLYLGSSTGLSSAPSSIIEGDYELARLGWSVSSAGDVNGDGYDDIIGGAPQYADKQTNEGRALLYVGSSLGLQPTPAWAAESNLDGAQFGCSVSSAGDVNNDGYDDVVIGAPTATQQKDILGRVDVYLGSSIGLSASPSWTIYGDQDSANFGNPVSSAGDVNNDGYDDVVLAADCYDNDQENEGRVFLYLGSSTGLYALPSWTGESNQVNASFGHSVSSAGDVNGDGYDEVIVGANTWTNGQTWEGRAYLYGEVVIPEFSILLIPVVGAVAIVVALRRLHISEKK